jgi:excisionase family DNA binding protein
MGNEGDVMKPVMTARDVATFLDVDEITVYRLARKGELPAFKVGGQWRFDRNTLDQWMTQRMEQRVDAITRKDHIA